MAYTIIICLVCTTTIIAEAYIARPKAENKNADILVNINVTTLTNDKEQATNIETISTNNLPEIKPTESQKNTDKEGINTASSQIYASYSPSSYEVYENLIDIPDDRTLAGPIVFYTKPPILNTVKPKNNTITSTDTEASTAGTEANVQNKKNKLSILHINAEYDEVHKEEHTNKVTGIFKGIKDYFNGIHKGIVSGIHNFFNKDVDGVKRKRSTDNQQVVVERENKRNSDNVDKTHYYVHHRHISLT